MSKRASRNDPPRRARFAYRVTPKITPEMFGSAVSHTFRTARAMTAEGQVGEDVRARLVPVLEEFVAAHTTEEREAAVARMQEVLDKIDEELRDRQSH